MPKIIINLHSCPKLNMKFVVLYCDHPPYKNRGSWKEKGDSAYVLGPIYLSGLVLGLRVKISFLFEENGPIVLV